MKILPMAVVIIACGCGNQGTEVSSTIEPLVVTGQSETASLEVHIDGQVLETSAARFGFASPEQAAATSIKVELFEDGQLVRHASIIPLRRCGELVATQPAAASVVDESLEVLLTTTAAQEELQRGIQNLIDGPCIECGLEDGTGVSGCPGGVVGL